MPSTAMSVRTSSCETDEELLEDRFDRSTSFVAFQAFGVSPSSPSAETIYKYYAVRETLGVPGEVFPLGHYSAPQVAAKIASAPAAFRTTLKALQVKLAAVLAHAADPAALEHHTVLFWPECNILHTFLGMEPRADEIIVACDVLRGQFRLRPVTEQALRALAEVFQLAADAPLLTSGTVDHCLDLLEAAGVEQRFPLSFADAHGD